VQTGTVFPNPVTYSSVYDLIIHFIKNITKTTTVKTQAKAEAGQYLKQPSNITNM